MDNDKVASKEKSTKSGLNIKWTASESIDHERGVLWYVIAVILAAAAIGLSWWLLDSLFSKISSTVLVAVIFLTIMTVSRRPARELNYVLDDEGLMIEGQRYPFDAFSAFGVCQDGALWRLTLIPVKRFGFAVTMYIHDDQGEKIVDALGARLPMQEVKIDLLDKIVHKLKI